MTALEFHVQFIVMAIGCWPRKPGNGVDAEAADGDKGVEVVGPKACPQGVPGHLSSLVIHGLSIVGVPSK